MSSLTLTLLILVLLGVGGVAFYNFWVLRGQSRTLTNRLIDDLDDRPAARRPEPSLNVGDATQHHRTAEPIEAGGPSIWSQDPDPATASVPPVEPVNHGAGPIIEPPSMAAPVPVPPVAPQAPAAVAVESADSSPVGRPAPVPAPIPVSMSPDQFHCDLNIELPEPQAGERLMRLTRDMGRVGAKPVEISARKVSPDAARFGPLQENERYDAIHYRLLLINRQGPLNAMEFSEFATHLQKLSDELDVLVDTPEMNEVLGQARELESRVAPLDAQIAVNVETGVPVSIDELARAAVRLGLKEQANQRHVRVDDRGEPVYSVALPDEANRIVLLLDVPRVARERQPIREMIETAWKLAQTFDGRMVDDSGQSIDNALFERIENQLDALYQALEATDLPAGSPLARRIFNL